LITDLVGTTARRSAYIGATGVRTATRGRTAAASQKERGECRAGDSSSNGHSRAFPGMPVSEVLRKPVKGSSLTRPAGLSTTGG
jgi:hypothetical protein